MGDVVRLRAGQMSTVQARAIADLAKQALRGVHLILESQKVLQGHATEVRGLPAPDAEP